ncbi:penicillin-binding protein activator LpoB [Myxococcota bacterium]|nr:penicillin-binding protein activator LpoB [Myxococcota bacterium]MBU1429805.1 penicillin-binding protein activator LpoB [Myxococcota bacterium]MBU1898234.1 penicillin-binding protein activator LpoB [Myxococcota bacterium]
MRALPLLALILLACGGDPAFVRGDENPELDEYAMSTGLDKRDLEKLFKENVNSLLSSGVVKRWADTSKPPAVAIFPVTNETSEHIDSQLQALLSKFETDLVNSGHVTVISYERQRGLVEELRKQQSAAFNPADAAKLGRQLGAQYFVTGKVYDAAEKSGEERRVQYFLFMQVVEIETGAIRWQNEANLTKGLVN